MRDKLIELIQTAVGGCAKHWAEIIADHLLKNGVIVPPCYIGQDIWQIKEYYNGRIEIRKGKVSMLLQKADKTWKIRITVKSSVWDFSPSEIGKRYFFSKEEAEKALAEGGK